MNDSRRQSDAQWYFRKDENADLFYGIFFKACKKYGIHWASATEKERAFIEEITRMTYEKEMAARTGVKGDDRKPSFGYHLSA